MRKVESTTDLIVREAQKRGITADFFFEHNRNLVLLELKEHQELIFYSSTNLLGRVTFKVFLNKMLTTILLRRAGFPVPEEIFTDNVEEIKQLLEKHKKIVIKPPDATWGEGVTPGITQVAELEDAIQYAHPRGDAEEYEGKVVCQQHVEGTEYRILVIDQKYVFAARRVPAHIEGDGQQTIHELIEQWNAAVREERRHNVTDQVKKLIRQQGWDLDSTPEKGAKVFLKLVANAHAGGTVFDATEEIGENARKVSLEIAQYFKAPVVGVDCISSDIQETIGHIIELNSTPDFTLHHYPTVGTPRNPAAKVVDMLFPETKK